MADGNNAFHGGNKKKKRAGRRAKKRSRETDFWRLKDLVSTFLY